MLGSMRRHAPCLNFFSRLEFGTRQGIAVDAKCGDDSPLPKRQEGRHGSWPDKDAIITRERADDSGFDGLADPSACICVVL